MPSQCARELVRRTKNESISVYSQRSCRGTGWVGDGVVEDGEGGGGEIFFDEPADEKAAAVRVDFVGHFDRAHS